jgi:aryl-alcohol dehydrogenase-like predicted oxidoreductase
MQYATLGSSGLMISRLSFGAGSLGVGETLPGLRKNLGQEQADRLVARAIDQRITLFDTSDAYAVIFGISREEQLDDNLKAADIRLTHGEVARLDALTAQPVRYPDWLLRMIPDPRTCSLLGLG